MSRSCFDCTHGSSFLRYSTSRGTPWPRANDGKVVVRTLLQAGVSPRAGDSKIARYIDELRGKGYVQ